MKRSAHFLLLTLVVAMAHGDWTPPEKPDPDAILTEARADTEAKRYGDALAKHVWFHHNALKYEEALYGVRLSFALSDWKSLCEVYPPALEKLKEIRDGNEVAVSLQTDLREVFHDFEAINETLGEEKRTTELFRWLHANQPEAAKQIYDLAEPALIKSQEYALATAYLSPEENFRDSVESYRMHLEMSKRPEFKDMKDFGEQEFTNETTTLVALLAKADRQTEATSIAERAKKEWNAPAFHEKLADALKGNVPPPWP